MATIKKATVEMVKDQVMEKVEQGQKAAEKEITKVRKQFNTALKSMEGYVRKNPDKAALISAGVGAAIGATLALLMGGKKKGKK
jgi:ElaB/YqjD/DUF883 family membrane-anchored ribosome-binding protein